MDRVPDGARPTQPVRRERYAPIRHTVQLDGGIVLVPCPGGGGGPHCETCTLDCIAHDYREQEGDR